MQRKTYKTILVCLLLVASQNTFACSGFKSAQCWLSSDNAATLSATPLPNLCLNQQTQAKKCYDAIKDNFDAQGSIYQAMQAKLKSKGICGSGGNFNLLGEVGKNGKKYLRASSSTPIYVTCP